MLQTQINKHLQIEPWLYLFMGLHLFCWTIIPFLIRYNLPLDAIEGTIWGHQLEWGYDKNPYLNGWLTALAVYLGGQSGWMIYLFSQLSVVMCFWAVWQLGKRMLGEMYAFISVLLLEGIQYYNFHAIDFNDNTLELGLWAMAIYFFYRATCPSNDSQIKQVLHWMSAGFFLSLGLMAKYYTALLAVCMLLFIMLQKRNRQQWKTLPPYLGCLIFLIVITPHIVWLFFHDFVTVNYVLARTSSEPSFTNHFFFPAQFAWQQFEAFLPALILFGLFFLRKSTHLSLRLNSFDQTFLFILGVGPFLLTLLLSVVFGITLRAGWGMPLLSLWGIILIAYFRPAITNIKFYGFLSAIFILMALLLTGYSYSLVYSDTPSSANFPGEKIAATVTRLWHEKYHTPLAYVAGSRWVGGNISFYSKDHPAVFVEWNPRHAAWIDQQELRKKGAVFIWEITANENLPTNIQKQFPELKNASVMVFALERNLYHLPPVQLGIAMLPPG